jgi:hypothetical protein
MRYRTYKNTDLSVSEVGFGLWTISTGWWGNFSEGEAVRRLRQSRRTRVRIHGRTMTDDVKGAIGFWGHASSENVQR